MNLFNEDVAINIGNTLTGNDVSESGQFRDTRQ